MAISDPLSITAAAPTPALAFAIVDTSKPYQTDRRDAATNYSLTISHTEARNGARRHYIKVTNTVLATSPTTNLDSNQTASVSLSISVPPFGFSSSDLTALETLLEAVISNATMAKILNMES